MSYQQLKACFEHIVPEETVLLLARWRSAAAMTAGLIVAAPLARAEERPVINVDTLAPDSNGLIGSSNVQLILHGDLAAANATFAGTNTKDISSEVRPGLSTAFYLRPLAGLGFATSGVPAGEGFGRLIASVAARMRGEPYDLLSATLEGGPPPNAPVIDITNTASIRTPNIAGIEVLSLAGKGDDGSGGNLIHSGHSGDPGDDGGDVRVINSGTITSGGPAIAARSIGGDGGHGGGGGTFTGGGGAGVGGSGGDVVVVNKAGGELTVTGNSAAAISVRSVGGKGGDGGGGGTITGSGTDGAVGGNGGDVYVGNEGQIDAFGEVSSGVHALSVGGGGGGGGGGGWIAGHSGDGGDGNHGGDASIDNSGQITTRGQWSAGVSVESVGGNGGDGGSSAGIVVAIGASGGIGGNGGKTSVDVSGTIRTAGESSAGAYAHSVGGGGGAGGSATSFSAGVGMAIGGSGGGGGAGGEVDMVLTGSVTTARGGSAGMVAQSVGGGGGSGGTAAGVSVGAGVSAQMTIGGSGGSGGNGGAVTVAVHKTGTIDTGTAAPDGTATVVVQDSVGAPTRAVQVPAVEIYGAHAVGVLAQSIGGGGGHGGSALSISASAGEEGSFAASVALGGSGGSGGNGNGVTVTNDGTVRTRGSSAQGIVAQSVGGGGGNGGNATAVAASVSAGYSASVTVALGGSGGSGGAGSTVSVTNTGAIETVSALSNGVLAQSIGGGGGNGGQSVTVGASGGEQSGTVGVTLGGKGGRGNTGGVASFNQAASGSIITHGNAADGVIVQSVGGGGGNGGAAHSYTASLATSQGAEPGSKGGKSLDLNVALGGDGGSGGAGQAANLTAAGLITTYGDGSRGAVVQSVGGGGGTGGNVSEVSLSGAANGVPSDDGKDKNTGKSAAINVGIGGKGGSGDHGGAATFTGQAGLKLTTYGAQADGVLVQSVGGGGGAGGNVHSVSFSTIAPDSASALPSPPGQQSGLSSLPLANPTGQKRGTALEASVGVGGKGGYGNNGGKAEANLASGAAVTTSGVGAHGVVIQSVGGGGGRGGSVNNLSAFGYRTKSLNIGVGGHGGLSGDGKDATFNGGVTAGAPAPVVTTSGDHAHALVVQSVGGGGGAGGSVSSARVDESYVAQGKGDPYAVSVGGSGGASGAGGTVSLSGDVTLSTTGQQAYGVLAQSIGGGGGDVHSSGSVDTTGRYSLNIGGNGSGGGNGGAVTVSGGGAIATSGALAHGIVAQSVGGGGGTAANSTGDSVTAPASGKLGATITIGGYNNSGGEGGLVTVRRSGQIETQGAHAVGLLAQSIGGGGGVGSLGAQMLGDPRAGNTANLFLGAYGRGSGGKVDISDAAADGVAQRLNILTHGAGAHALFAQSVGSGGGLFLSSDSNAINVTVAENGALGKNDKAIYGAGGDVRVSSRGELKTTGDFATGIFAMSASGGAAVVQTDTGPVIHVRADSLQGMGGSVTIAQSGSVRTAGTGGHGVLAYAQNGGAGVNVSIDGLIETQGAGANGVTTTNAVVGQLQAFQRTPLVLAAQLGAIAGIPAPVTTRITVGRQGMVSVGAANATAISVADAWLSTQIDIGGQVANRAAASDDMAVAINSTNNAIGGAVNILAGGSVLGRLTGSNYKLNLSGSLTGSVAGASDYVIRQGGVHTLVVDPVGGFVNSIRSNILTSDGEIRLRLASFADVHNPQVLVHAARGLGDFGVADISSPLAVNFGLVKTEPGTIMLTSAKVNFAGVNMDSNSEAIAASADAVVAQLVAAGDRGAPVDLQVRDHLLAAANSWTVGDLQTALGVFDHSNDTNALVDHTGAVSAATAAAHSCGSAEGDNASIQEAECTWARVATRSVDYEEPGAETHMDSLSFGRQVALDDVWRAGLAFAYAQDKSETAASRGEGESYHATAVAKRVKGGWLSSAALTASYREGDYAREIDHAGVREIAKSSQKLFSAASRFKLARAFDVGVLDIRPGIAVDAVWLHNFGYDETGSGLASARVKANSQMLYNVRPSVRLGTDLQLAGGLTLRPYVQAGLDWAVNDAVTEVMIGSLASAELSDNRSGVIPEFSAGLSLLRSDRFEAKLEYEGSYADTYTAEMASLKVAAKF